MPHITQSLRENPEQFIYEEPFFSYLMCLEERGELSTLPHNLYVFYVLITAFGEVNNGGFSALMYNSTYDLFSELCPCADALGIDGLSALIHEFTDTVKSALGSHELPYYDFDDDTEAKFSEFDDRFYDLDEECDLYGALLAYYNEHFTVDEITYSVDE